MRLWMCFALLGCKSADTDPDSVVDCSDCERDGALCIAHLDESGATDPYARCAPVPSECGALLDCGDNTCVLDAYALCDPGFVGGLCAADETPSLTCYADTP